MVLHGSTVWESRTPPGIYESPGPKARAFLFFGVSGGPGPEPNTIPGMTVDPREGRASRSVALRGAAVGLLLAAALLGPALATGGVPARGDLPDFFWPMKAYTAERWAGHEIPLWNPLSGGGEPWLAQLQSGALYPGDLPFLFGWRKGAMLGIALHLALAAGGMAYWLWDLGGSRPAALLAGGLFAGGGAFLSLVPVYNNACTAAWLPWLFAGARRIIVGRSRGAGFAIALAGAFLAGEPAIAAVGGVAAMALALFAGAEGEAPEAGNERKRVLARAALAFLAGVALAGAALLPFAALLQSSGRRTRTTPEEAVARAVGPSDLADLVAAPRPEATRLVSPGRGGYLVTLALGPLPLLLAAGVGAGLPGRRKLVLGLALLAATGTLLALGAAGLLVPLLFEAGLFRGLRFPARWIIFPHLALAIAAGAGLDGWLWGRFVRNPPSEAAEPEEHEVSEWAARRRLAIAALGAGLVVLFLLAALAWLLPEARTTRDRNRTLATTTAALLGAAAIAIAAKGSHATTRRAGAFVVVLALAPLPYVAGEALATVPASAVCSFPGLLGHRATGPEAGRVFAPAGQDRTLALRWKFAAGAAWGEGAVRRAAMALAGYSNLFHGVASASTASPIGDPRAERLVGAALAGGDPVRILALLNVRRVLTPFRTNTRGLLPAGEAEGLRLYEVQDAVGRAFLPLEARVATDDEAFEALRMRDFDPGRTALVAGLPEGTRLPPPRMSGGWAAVRFLSDEPERTVLSSTASAASLLVLARTWDPGWTATIDGGPVPLLRAHLALLALVLPPGEHRIELAYRPASFRYGLGLSGVGLLGVLALSLAAPPGGRRR